MATADNKKVRVLMGKVGLDAHDTGAVVISNLLKDAGMEVIYLGIHNSIEGIVKAAQQEDVDVIGLSFLGGEHIHHTKKLMDRLKKVPKGKYLVLVGGVIPPVDVPELKEIGVDGVFGPGTKSGDVVKFIRENVH